jgi:hypothetical protein
VQNESKSILAQQQQAIFEAALSGDFTDQEIVKIARLADYLTQGEEQDAFTETMYGYLAGKQDWKEHYREFFGDDEPPRSTTDRTTPPGNRSAATPTAMSVTEQAT